MSEPIYIWGPCGKCGTPPIVDEQYRATYGCECFRDHRHSFRHCRSGRAKFHCDECDHHQDEHPSLVCDISTDCWTPPCPEPRCQLRIGHEGQHRADKRTEAGLFYTERW